MQIYKYIYIYIDVYEYICIYIHICICWCALANNPSVTRTKLWIFNLGCCVMCYALVKLEYAFWILYYLL